MEAQDAVLVTRPNHQPVRIVPKRFLGGSFIGSADGVQEEHFSISSVEIDSSKSLSENS
jgi:hypothetical protein